MQSPVGLPHAVSVEKKCTLLSIHVLRTHKEDNALTVHSHSSASTIIVGHVLLLCFVCAHVQQNSTVTRAWLPVVFAGSPAALQSISLNKHILHHSMMTDVLTTVRYVKLPSFPLCCLVPHTLPFPPSLRPARITSPLRSSKHSCLCGNLCVVIDRLARNVT